MAGLLVSYSDAIEGTFSEVAEGEHFYHHGYLVMRETVDGSNALQYTGDVERNRIVLQDDAPVRILKDCTVRPDDGSVPPPEPPVEPPPEEILSEPVDSEPQEG